MDENKDNRETEPLELRYKLFFFFVPIMLSIFGPQFKALGYVQKEKDKWRYMGAGYFFYFILLLVVVRLLN